MDSSENLKTALIKVDKNKNSEVQHIGSSKKFNFENSANNKRSLILKTALIKIKKFGT
jgi:hypothetical protein